MDPKGVERGLVSAASKSAKDPAADRRGRRDAALVAPGGQELVPIAVQKRNIPGDLDPEPLVLVAADGEVRAEQYRQVDVRLTSDSSQQWCLVLNRVTDQIGQPD